MALEMRAEAGRIPLQLRPSQSDLVFHVRNEHTLYEAMRYLGLSVIAANITLSKTPGLQACLPLNLVLFTSRIVPQSMHSLAAFPPCDSLDSVPVCSPTSLPCGMVELTSCPPATFPFLLGTGNNLPQPSVYCRHSYMAQFQPWECEQSDT